MVFSFCFIFAVLKWQKSLSCEIFYIWKALKHHNIPPLFLWGRASSPSRFRCLEDDILSILILLVFVFLVRMSARLKTGSGFSNHFWTFTDLQGIFHRCRCCCWWCCFVVTHNLDRFLMQPCSRSATQARPPRCRGNFRVESDALRSTTSTPSLSILIQSCDLWVLQRCLVFLFRIQTASVFSFST